VIKPARLGAARPGDWTDPPNPLDDWTRWDRDDWRANKKDFLAALQARADLVGHATACSELAVVAMRHLRNVRLEVDSQPSHRRQYREGDRMEAALRMSGAIQNDLHGRAIRTLERLYVPPAEIKEILAGWRVLHGVRERYALDESVDQLNWPGKEELIAIVSARRSVPHQEPEPVAAPPPPTPIALEPEPKPMRADLLEACATVPAAEPKKAHRKRSVRRG
jgi:hypothetical protein